MGKNKDTIDENETTEVDLGSIRAARARAGQPRAVLSVVSGNQTGRPVPLDRMPANIGRHRSCRVRLIGHGVSRRHARIALDVMGHYLLEDLDSTNGTYVNGNLIRSQRLTEGDIIQIGPSTVLDFTYEEPEVLAIRVKQYEESIRDELTGIYNRRFFFDTLKSELAYARRHDVAMSLIIMDLDELKQINESGGHQSGDALLRNIAEITCGVLRKEDLFARYGGDEFVVLLRGQDCRRSYITAERIRMKIKQSTTTCGDHEILTTVSLGIATYNPGSHMDPDALIDEADQALHEAKHQGRDRTHPPQAD